MQSVRYGRDQCFEEAHGGRTIGFVVQFDEGEFRGSVNRDEQVELALCCSNLSDIDMEIADRVGFEFSFLGALVLNLRQARDAMAASQGPQALLTILYRSTDRRCRCGAAVKNLAHSASLHAGENSAPSKLGTKQVGLNLPFPFRPDPHRQPVQ